MKFLEFRDTNNILQVIPLLKSFFSSVTYPLNEKSEIITAQLFTNDNKVISIPGNDFKIISVSGGAAID